jgi:hypothetical protein
MNIKDMPAYQQMRLSAEGTPLAVVDETAEEHLRTVVRSGVLCLIHQRWDILVWDGMHVGPLCCLQP